MRRTVPAVVAVLVGLALLGDLIVDAPGINALGQALLEGLVVLGAFALILAALKLLGSHASRLAQREGDRLGSVVLLVALLVALGLGIARPGGEELQWLFDYVYQPLQATTAALLAFFGIQGAYRAFRLRTGEAAGASVPERSHSAALVRPPATIAPTSPPTSAARMPPPRDRSARSGRAPLPLPPPGAALRGGAGGPSDPIGPAHHAGSPVPLPAERYGGGVRGSVGGSKGSVGGSVGGPEGTPAVGGDAGRP